MPYASPKIFAAFGRCFPLSTTLDRARLGRVLRNAIKENRGIGIFELANRSLKTLLVLCFTPLLVLLLTPWIRPLPLVTALLDVCCASGPICDLV